MNCCYWRYVLLVLLSILIQLDAIKPRESDVCFEDYKRRTEEANVNYAREHEKCRNHAQKRQAKLTSEKEAEREQIMNATLAICNGLRNCNQHETHEDFFQCHTEIGFDNANTLISLHLSAYALAVELGEEYEETEKDVIICQIETHRAFINDTQEAHKELQLCLAS